MQHMPAPTHMMSPGSMSHDFHAGPPVETHLPPGWEPPPEGHLPPPIHHEIQLSHSHSQAPTDVHQTQHGPGPLGDGKGHG